MDARTNIESRLPGRHGTKGSSCAPSRSCNVAVEASANASHAALHLRLFAGNRGIKFDSIDVAEIDDVESFKKTPCAAGLNRGGRYLAKDMREVGGIPLLMNTLLDNGHLRGDCTTATGRTTAENLKSAKPIAVLDGVGGLTGNYAPEGEVVKVAGMSKRNFPGSGRSFDLQGTAFGSLNVKLTGADAPELETNWQSRATNVKSAALWNDAQGIGQAMDGVVSHPGGAHEKHCYADI